MPRNIFAGGGVNAFQGENSPLYVQNMNSLKAAFTDLQNGTVATGPIGSVIMWSGTTANIPAGYAVANGAYLNTVTYASLYAIIGTRYGPLAGVTFPLPNFTSTVPVGITGAPVVPSTKTTSVSSAVDAHTHTVNSALTGANSNIGINTGNVSTHTHAGGILSGANSNIGLGVGTANTHTHAGSVLTQGNVDAHLHGIAVSTGDESIQHAHTTSGQSANHTHTYFRPNTGANSVTGSNNLDHTHTVNSNTTNHTHGILANSQNATSTLNTSITAPGAPNAGLGINLTGANSNIAVSQIDAPNLYPFFPAVTGISIVLTGSNSNIGLTAGTATTINASSLAHTHTTASTQIVFIIRVS